MKKNYNVIQLLKAGIEAHYLKVTGMDLGSKEVGNVRI